MDIGGIVYHKKRGYWNHLFVIIGHTKYYYALYPFSTYQSQKFRVDNIIKASKNDLLSYTTAFNLGLIDELENENIEKSKFAIYKT